MRELHLGDKVTVTFQLLDHDDKRLRAYQEIRHTDGWLAATSESLSLHVDMSGPEGRALSGRHRGRRSRRCAPPMPACPMPERAGRVDRHQAQERLMPYWASPRR